MSAEVSMITWQAVVGVEQVSVIGRPVRLGKPGRTVAPDGQQSVSEAWRVVAPKAFQALAYGLRDGAGQGLARHVGQLLRELVGRGVLDVQAHGRSLPLTW